jgi:hypothetical protein
VCRESPRRRAHNGPEEKGRPLDARLGFSLRDDFLRHLGPGVGVVADPPPIDQAAGLIMSGASDGNSRALGGIALRLEVGDEAAVRRGLDGTFALAGDGLRVETTEAHTRLCWQPPETAEPAPSEPPPPCLFVAVGEGALRMGFTAERVAALASPLAPKASLAAGADYLQVVAQLDPNPQSLL